MLLALSAVRLTRLSALPVDGLAETLPPRVSPKAKDNDKDFPCASLGKKEDVVGDDVGWVVLFTFAAVLIIFSPFVTYVN